MKGMDLLAWKKRLITGVFQYKYVLLVILVGVVLLLLPPLWGEKEVTEESGSQATKQDDAFSTAELEDRLGTDPLADPGRRGDAGGADPQERPSGYPGPGCGYRNG